jgi:RNA polymerase sigma-70 factor (ECF subfamily)
VPGPKPSFDELYRDFFQRIYAFVRAQVGTTADAEDVTAQVFMRAYEAYGRYEPRAATPAAWLFQIARNGIRDHHRRLGRRERLFQAVANEPAEAADPAALAEDRLRHAQLLELVARLPERQREAVALRHSGLSFQEVGDLLDASEDAAKMLYHRALKALREAAAGTAEPGA